MLRSRLSAALLVVALFHLASCGGGGGSGGAGSASFDKNGTLLSVTFPDPVEVNPEAQNTPPGASPLVQQIVFTFSGKPNPQEVQSQTISIRDQTGFSVEGAFDVQGQRITFTPKLPVREASATDNGGAGLQPATNYVIKIGPSTWRFVTVAPNLLALYADPVDPASLLLTFRTTELESDYFRGLTRTFPRLESADPQDGALGVSPQLYSDPQRKFPKRRAFFLEFDAPILPTQENLDSIRLVDLDDRPVDFPAGLPLGIETTVVVNELGRSVVEILPSGILPFGHLLSLEFPTDLRGLSQSGVPVGDSQIATTFAIANASGTPIVDLLFENFDSITRREDDVTQLAEGVTPAEWDALNSNVLQPGLFEGTGVLGRFTPPAPDDGDPKILVFDTSRQVFPLLDGSTPDAIPGTEITGGVFPFTDIDIPANVTINVVGPNPLIFTATGSVRIAGEFRISGLDGINENAFDSSNTSNPGGPGQAGGGRGGEGQPIIWQGTPGASPLISPDRGGRGWGSRNTTRNGGVGGESGMLDNPDQEGLYGTDYELDTSSDNVSHGWAIGGPPPEPCQELVHPHNNGYKPPGGGGGSHFVRGRKPLNGIGNVRSDGEGRYVVTTMAQDPENWNVLFSGAGGQKPFADENLNNDFIGVFGEQKELFAGQGGGAGGSALDSYFCGDWCLNDTDPSNDFLCVDEASYPANPIVDGVEGDARGGSGGGGGGALSIKALGPLTLESGSVIECSGGEGGSGEAVECGNWAGGGGGGSGGAVILQSAADIIVEMGAIVDVAGGLGATATDRRAGNTQKNLEATAFDADGNFFGVLRNGARTELHDISKAHALTIKLKDLTRGNIAGEALCFNSDDGLLYHASGANTFESVDPVTLQLTPVPLDPLFVALGRKVSALAYSPEKQAFFWAESTGRTLNLVFLDGSFQSLGPMDHLSNGLALKDGDLYSISGSDKMLRKIRQVDGQTLFTTPDIVYPSFGLQAQPGTSLATNPETNELWGSIKLTNQQVLTGDEVVSLDVETGLADHIGTSYSYINAPNNCRKFSRFKVGSGGRGGNGLIQLQLKGGQQAQVADPDNSLTSGSWVDPMNLSNPADFTSLSSAQSTWFDLGRVTERPPSNTNPLFSFSGLDHTGEVLTDAEGNVINPETTDIQVDFLGVLEDPDIPGSYVDGLEPRSNFIPPNATVSVKFQGANAIAEGSKEVDPASLTDWAAYASIANGFQFIRYRIDFNITAQGQQLEIDTPRPTVQSIRIPSRF